MSANFSVLNLLKIITEVKTNPHQTPEDLYSTFNISKSGFYKYKKLLEQEIGFITFPIPKVCARSSMMWSRT
jgi:hypothetical protein